MAVTAAGSGFTTFHAQASEFVHLVLKRAEETKALYPLDMLSLSLAFGHLRELATRTKLASASDPAFSEERTLVDNTLKTVTNKFDEIRNGHYVIPTDPFKIQLLQIVCLAINNSSVRVSVRPPAGLSEFTLMPIMAVFSLSHPARFEFGGLIYPSAMHAFFAQMYPNDREIQEEFTHLETAVPVMDYTCTNERMAETGAAIVAGKSTPVEDYTKALENFAEVELKHLVSLVQKYGNRCTDWESKSEEIMLHVLRAKFGQNPEMQKYLIATLDNDLLAATNLPANIWNNGEDNNRLGRLLRIVRKEYGGID